jgi:hypothetical protein
VRGLLRARFWIGEGAERSGSLRISRKPKALRGLGVWSGHVSSKLLSAGEISCSRAQLVPLQNPESEVRILEMKDIRGLAAVFVSY